MSVVLQSSWCANWNKPSGSPQKSLSITTLTLVFLAAEAALLFAEIVSTHPTSIAKTSVFFSILFLVMFILFRQIISYILLLQPSVVRHHGCSAPDCSHRIPL